MKDQYSDAAQPTLLELLSDREGQAEPHVIGVTGSDRTDQVPIPETLPILVIRNLVVFPGTVVPLSIRRKSSRQLLDESLTHSKVIGLMTQKKADIEQPGPDDIYPVGVAALVLKMIRQPDETVLLVIQALQRISLRKIVQVHPYMRAEVQVLQSTAPANNNEFEAMFRNLRETAGKLVELSPDVPDQARVLIMNIEEPGQLADFVASTLPLDVTRKQQLLEQTDVAVRMRAVQESVNNQLQIAQIQQRLQDDVASHMSDNQRRAYLREQLKAIQRELGETGGAEEQVENLRTRLDEAAPPESVREQADRELKRLEYVPPASPEYSVIIGYLETIANLPWNKLSKDNLDLNQAQRILDRDHYDLQKVKRRLIEYLAVRKLNPEGRGPILCFLGPPGVGKTSLGQSIADALGRKFSRMSLGGIRDEAEIRGHRRTYIGAMPGRIIQELRRVGTRN
ncbi:MAG: LON peptidase substrate-binding domain-containing protein, partial [Limisphaerales bacterium]